MPDVFQHHHTVLSSEIDELGHANNAVYVNWMQAAAIAHSNTQGWPSSRYREHAHAWVARSHHIDYLSPAFADDEIIVHTWIAAMQRATCVRRYEMVRSSDQTVLARAETRWAYIHLETRRPTRIPSAVLDDFVIVDKKTL